MRSAASFILCLLTTWPLWAQFDAAALPQGAFDHDLAPWTVGYGAPAWDGETGHAAPGCMKLVDAGALWSPLIPIGDEFVQLSVWMKTDGILRGTDPWHQATVQVVYFDRERKSLGHFDPGQAIGTTDWTKVEALLHWERKSGVAFFQVGLLNWNCTGTSWFDDVELTVAPVPEAYRLMPPLAQIEKQPPRLWPMPKLGAEADTARGAGVSLRLAAGGASGRLAGPAGAIAGSFRLAAQPPMASDARPRRQIARGYMERLAVMPAESSVPTPGTVEAYAEAFRGSPLTYYFWRAWLPRREQHHSLVGRLELDAPDAKLWGFEGDRLMPCPEGRLTLDQTTTKPFVILRRPDDSGGLIIYHPIPAELRRWYLEDYRVEAEPRIRVQWRDGTLSYHTDKCTPTTEGFIHSLDFYFAFMPYSGRLAEAMQQFAVCDRDLLADEPPFYGEAPRGMWQPYMDYSTGQRLLKMARYFPREFSSHMDSSGWDYGHPGGHGWGCTNATMKGIRVNPLAATALQRDHALRMLTFFVEYAGPQGAPWNCYTWRGGAMRMGDPALQYRSVFCQFWEWRMGEFRSLFANSELVTAAEKARLYADLQRARHVFDPHSPGSWTVTLPDGSYWFDYFDQPPTRRRENLFIVNTHTTSLGNAGEFALMAREMHRPADEAWWSEIFTRGIDGLLWATAQDFMWTEWDPNEVVYGGRSGGPQGYARYMVSEWLPHVMRLDVELGLEHRLDELLALQHRMMQAKYVQASAETMRYGQEGLDWVKANRKR